MAHGRRTDGPILLSRLLLLKRDREAKARRDALRMPHERTHAEICNVLPPSQPTDRPTRGFVQRQRRHNTHTHILRLSLPPSLSLARDHREAEANERARRAANLLCVDGWMHACIAARRLCVCVMREERGGGVMFTSSAPRRVCRGGGGPTTRGSRCRASG